MDPVLGKKGYDYGCFLGELYKVGILERAVEAKEIAGVFFVARKDARLRLIFDTRRPNAHFVRPRSTALASGESLADIQVDPSTDVLELAAGDVEVCFYQYLLPPRLRGFFCLPAVRGRGRADRARAAGHVLLPGVPAVIWRASRAM